MRFIFFWLTGSILITNLFIQAVDSFLDDIFSSSVDDTSGLELNPDLDDNLWSSDATDFIDSAAAGDGLIFDDYATTIASTACSPSSSNSLKRRGDGVLCSIQKPDDVKGQNHPDVEIRPLGTTKDQPLLFPVFNYEICDAQIMGISRAFAACDSGREEDRKPTIDAGVYVLEHCTPCKCWAPPKLLPRFFFFQTSDFFFFWDFFVASRYPRGMLFPPRYMVLHRSNS